MNLEKFNTYTDEELYEIFNTVAEIQKQRKAEKKNRLVTKFKEAYIALQAANIKVRHDGVGVAGFDEFDFD